MEKELIIKVVELNGNVRVEIKGIASDKMLIMILNDVIKQLYKRNAKQILSVNYQN